MATRRVCYTNGMTYLYALIVATLVLQPLFTHAEDVATEAPITIQPQQLDILKEIDQRYQKAKSVLMTATKTDKISALDQTNTFEGKIWLKKGKFRVELETKDKNKDKSLIVADGTTLWFVTPPPKEFKGAKTLVVKADLKEKRAKAQGLLQILTEGGVLKYFKATGVQTDGDTLTYFLQPDKKSLELRRAEVVANRKDKTIHEIKYWDSNDNETSYQFSKVEFDKPVDATLLTYKPPKDADVTTY